MKVIIEFDEEKLIRDVMENYPEYSSPSLRCRRADYDHCVFSFHDVEEDKRYEVNLPMLKKGLETLLDLVKGNQLPGLSINLTNFQDVGEWDCDCADALVQCAIFKEVIYG